MLELEMGQPSEADREKTPQQSRLAAFFEGMGRVVDLGATGYQPPEEVPFTSYEDGAKALQGDFDRVAADIRKAFGLRSE